MQRALVIGGTGFIGRHIVSALVDRDVDVAVLRRWDSDRTAIDELGVPQVVADLTGDNSLVSRLAGFNYVFYAAAVDTGKEDQRTLEASVVAIRRLLAAARAADVERLAITSCASTVGARADGEPSTADDVYLPGSAGDERVDALYAAEQECFREAADNLDLTILNPGICLADGAVFPRPEVLSFIDAGQRINLVDVESVAEAHLVSMADLHYGRRFVLGGRDTTVGEVLGDLEVIGERSGRLYGFDVDLMENLDDLRHAALFRQGCWLDSEDARDDLAFNPRLD